jgi:transposase
MVCHAERTGWSTLDSAQRKADRMARTYFPLTTPSQRRLLFETWQATGSVEQACRVAHIGRRTFYYWKPRFLAEGYAGLEQFGSRVPHQPHRTAPAVEAQVIALKQEQPSWGKQRLADELAQAHGWVPLVSPNTVKRILRDAGLWAEPAPSAKRGDRVVRTAPRTSPARP